MTAAPHPFLLHRLLFAALVPILVAASAIFAPPLYWQLITLAPLVALLGLPHGALDHRVAGALWPLRSAKAHMSFVSGYLGLSAAVLLAWMLAPGPALAAFLVYSAYHFSDDWRQEIGLLHSLPLGISVIALPALAWQTDVAALFAYLAPTAFAAGLASLLHDLAVASLAAAVFCLALNMRRQPWLAAEFGLLAATGLLVPPLVYFAIYFCGLHSPRHFLMTADQLGLTPVQGLRAALPVTAATLAMAAAGAATLMLAAPSFETVTMLVIFAGLAAVTVPHMLLTERFRAMA